MRVLALRTSSFTDDTDDTLDDNPMMAANSARPSLGLDCLDTVGVQIITEDGRGLLAHLTYDAAHRLADWIRNHVSVRKEPEMLLSHFIDFALPLAASELLNGGHLSQDGHNNLLPRAPESLDVDLVLEIARADPDAAVRALADAVLHLRAGNSEQAAEALFRAGPEGRDWLRHEASCLLAVSFFDRSRALDSSERSARPGGHDAPAR